MRYRQVVDGEWRPMERRENVACCDCGLVHTYKYRTKKGYLHRQAIRDTKATWARRKRLGISLKRTK